MSERQVGIQGIDYREQRRNALVTPVTFSALLGATSTTIYTGATGEGLLIRHMGASNPTVGAADLTVTVGGVEYVTGKSMAANDASVLDTLSGLYIDDGENIAGIGDGLRVYGWGLRIRGALDWRL